MNSPKLKIFQIYYNEETKRRLDPGFIPLDNSSNLRPDWSEYWPIRQVLLNSNFSDNDYIGFFSPRFQEKTHCRSADVIEIVTSGNSDVCSFSPFFDHSALHLNPFEQGERFHKGIAGCSEQFIASCNLELDVRNLVSDHTTTVFSNYFVARYDFWMVWFSLAEKIFNICESGSTSLGMQLTGNTYHRGIIATPLKVFLIERLITILLEKFGISAKLCVDALNAPLLFVGAEQFVNELVLLDALKGQFKKTNNQMFLASYKNLRSKLLSRLQVPQVTSF